MNLKTYIDGFYKSTNVVETDILQVYSNDI